MEKYSNKLLKELYRMMLKIRLCEEGLVEPIIKGEIKTPCHLYTGQETIATGVCAALYKNDYIFGNHRSHGHYLAKGGSIKELIAEVFCKEAGCVKGRGGSMHVCTPRIGMLCAAPIVAGTISLALGCALAARIKKEKSVTVTFFGDGAVGEGVLYESLNFAALKKLPILFVCENNFYSTHLPIKECRLSDEIFRIAEPFKIPSYKVDGNDVLKVYEIAKKAVRFCRANKGPVFIECVTYRFRGHVGPDDNIQGTRTDIRPAREIEKWRKKDPIARFERYLYKNRVIHENTARIIRDKIIFEVDRALKFAKNIPNPENDDLTDHVFKK
jgi:acetoin:2,6-dichlorophenolindophenol oxidoreductase subunit alpha